MLQSIDLAARRTINFFFDIWVSRRFVSRRMKTENPWIELAPGIRRRTVTHGETMYQMIAELKAGSVMPPHQHPQEQIIHIISGRMKVNVGNDSRVLGPGDSYYLASNIPHGVETLEDTRVLDTFSPPRHEYIALDKQKMGDA
jgi:quercetin dioxygenase-like cupin family protein